LKTQGDFWIHKGIEPQVYFWRTAAGSEVDIVIDTGEKIIPVEVKSSSTPKPAMASGILAFRKDLGKKTASGYVIHSGKTRIPLGSDVTALPFAEI